eukprot:gnl/Dysnectes_brevis/5233_a7433_477.p1 GENE.gnl/Dysnectes_brevis/5233_a7433_477~~gnl/Dysnectes_brevis/5233_a7433_477.p1  ORF type:complete len:141 (+),score=16.99 gnl/Dysnectes_brevis/5233_a7433_477:109-531(+)
MDRGTYTAPDGSTVSIADDLQFSKDETITTIKALPKPTEPETFDTDFYLERTTTIEAIQAWQPRDDTIGVLNFASAKNPGGGFLSGSRAQEKKMSIFVGGQLNSQTTHASGSHTSSVAPTPDSPEASLSPVVIPIPPNSP